MSHSELTAFVALLSIVVWVRESSAAGPLGPNGTPIQTSDYALDLYHGPVFAGSRVTALGGAYVAIAEDVDGDLQNPATPAVRPFFSYSHFDYWLGFGFTFPATLSNMDFFNSGAKTQLANAPDAFVFFSPALNLQFGELGVGLTLEVQQYEISGGDQDTAIRVTIPTTHVQFAHGVAHNQFVFGVGARFVAMTVGGPESRDTGFESNGLGLEFGIVYKPERRPFRLGIALRTGIETRASYSDSLLPNAMGDVVIPLSEGGTSAYLPKAVALPWDLNFGFAVQIGRRPLNPPWRLSSELTERDTLTHRLKEIDRERRRERAFDSARTPEERQKIAETLNREQAADDRELERARLEALQRVEQSLREMNRFYVTISGSMLLSGPVDRGLGVESLVTQTVNRSGERAVVSPRVGVEVGVLPDLLKLRGGGYLEPTRFDTSSPRVHGTAGLALRLVRWNVLGMWPDNYVWQLGLGGDASQRYYVWGVSIGGWYPRTPGMPEATKAGLAQ